MSGESTFYCEKCDKKWEGFDFYKICLDCRKEMINDCIDLIFIESLDYKRNKISKEIYLSKIKSIIKNIEEL